MPKECWLVISYWANCKESTPSFHVDDRLPHLQRAGIELEVITSICGPRPEGWRARWHCVPSLSPSGIRFEVRHLARRLPRPWGTLAKTIVSVLVFPFYLLEKCLIRVDSTFWWWVPAGLLGICWTARRRPDLIYSSGGAVSGHLAAALIAAVRRVPWIAEIRDPLPSQSYGRGLLFERVLAWAEGLIHAHATGVVYLTQAACERARRRAGDMACAVIYPGAEAPAAAPAPARGAHLRMVHAGSLAGSRNPVTLLAALAQLAERWPRIREQVRLIFVGSLDDASQRAVRSFAYPEMLEAVAKLPRPEAQEMVQQADVALVIQNCEPISEETIPSKVYEYLLAGRPILALTYRNSELDAMLTEAGHWAVPVDDVMAIESALEDVYAQWESGRLPAKPYGRYTRAGAAAELISWSRGLRGLPEKDEGAVTWRAEVSSSRPSGRS